jgi:hypothetical protein
MHDEAFKITLPERTLRNETGAVYSAAETEYYQAYRAAYKKSIWCLGGPVVWDHASELTYTEGFHAKDLGLLLKQGTLSADEFAAHTGAAAATGLLKPFKDEAQKAYVKACKAYDAAYVKAYKKLAGENHE